eukprot:scaffold76607_cov20-Tisochrysis_lutea.AAC.1
MSRASCARACTGCYVEGWTNKAVEVVVHHMRLLSITCPSHDNLSPTPRRKIMHTFFSLNHPQPIKSTHTFCTTQCDNHVTETHHIDTVHVSIVQLTAFFMDSHLRTCAKVASTCAHQGPSASAPGTLCNPAGVPALAPT